MDLRTAVQMYPTPQAGANNPAAHNAMSGDFKTKLCEVWGIPVTGRLNPQWVSWLMGYPVDWCDLTDESPKNAKTESTSLEDSAMPSSRKSPKR
jgi:hypothetical protein